MNVDGALLGPVGFLVAFFVGTISFFSPCVLPLLPGYLGFVSSVGGEQGATAKRHRVVLATLLFVAGFAVIFTALGATATALGDFLTDNIRIFNQISGVVVIALGLIFMLPSLAPSLQRERRPFFERVKPGMAGAFPLGMAFGFGWTPCVGPGLGVMLNLAGPQGRPVYGGLLLLFFSFGLGIWFILGSLGAERLLRASWFKRNLRKIQFAGGVLMVALGILLVTNKLYDLMAPLLRWGNSFAI
jgi:cytochrome c-type biogenesis protein